MKSSNLANWGILMQIFQKVIYFQIGSFYDVSIYFRYLLSCGTIQYRFAEFFVGFEQIISPVDPNVFTEKECVIKMGHYKFSNDTKLDTMTHRICKHGS